MSGEAGRTHLINHVGGEAFLAFKRHIALLQPAHVAEQCAAGFGAVGGCGGRGGRKQAAVVASGNGVLYAQAHVGIVVFHGAIKHHAQRTGVDTHPRGGFAAQEFHLFRSEQLILQRLCLVVDCRAYGVKPTEAGLKRLCCFEQRFAAVYIDVFADIFAENL